MKKTIYLAGGCFWGTEKYLWLIPGVEDTEAGYANRNTENPSYEDVCRRRTGHAESVKVIYDTEKVSLATLLEKFYMAIDPTAINRQGNDIGSQYRSGVYYVDIDDVEIIKKSIKILQEQYRDPIAIEVKPLSNYYKAEEYHQKYLQKNPGGYCHINNSAFEKAKSIEKIYPKKSKEELKKSLHPCSLK